jgi:MFS family permease
MPTGGQPQEEAQIASSAGRTDRYKWIALSNTTLGILMVTINQSILLISLPALFRGIKLNPLESSNTSYFLWVFLGFILVTAVLVVSLGRVGDIYGRVKMYNLGFAVFTLFSILLSVTFLTGVPGVLWIIIMRILQGVGGAFLFANSSAILTDAFPPSERGKAMGINGVAAVSGAFLGLLLGGVLAPIEWRLVFLVSVPFGLFGTVWAYLKLKDNGIRIPAKIDWLGNTLFAVGLIAVLTGIVYSLLPYGGHPTGWTNPWVLGAIIGGVAILVLFAWVETKVPEPMFRLSLFKIRAFTAGNIAGLLAALGRGGIQLMLIIWLQGIWLPQHGRSFSETPLWAGIAMVPLTIGFLITGPLAGVLSDRYGSRVLATAGLAVSGGSFLLLEVLPINFSYIWFALLILLFSIGMGHEQPAAGPAGRGRGHAEHVPELGHRAVDGPVLHHRHPGPGRAAARPPVQGPGRRRGLPRGRAPGGQRAADRQPVLGVPGLQPDQGAARAVRRAGQAAPAPGGLHHGPLVLPEADRAAVRGRPAPGVHVRGHRDGDRRRGLRGPRQAVPARDRAAGAGTG